MMSAITVRPARAADKDAVLAFTQKTFAWGDYIHHVWDDWLASPTGELAVAEIAGRPVAVAMTTMLSPGEGWLQGLRVHPDYRRQGVARAMTAHQVAWLRQHGVAVVRLAVNCQNVASQAHTVKGGFGRLATFIMAEQDGKDLVDSGDRAQTVGPADADAAWAFIEQSPTRRAAAGLWEREWAWQRLTRAIFQQHIGQEHVAGVLSGDHWAALAIASPGHGGQEIGYVDGEGPALERLARALAARAKQAGAEFNTVALPPVPAVVSAFRRAGYAPGTADGIYIYELGL